MIGYRFKPKLSMTIATVIVMLLCIKLGSWQYNKAQAKIALQQQFEQGLTSSAVKLPSQINDVEAWRFKRVKFEGIYKPEYQLLLDNQVNDSVVGYHVLTPVQLMGSKQYVLVNRGWIKGNLNRKVPVVDTPEGKQYFEGDIFFPLAKFFTLEDTAAENGKWKTVWQHIDMGRYKKVVPFEVMPYIVRLDANSSGGGFGRNWPVPKDRVSVHLGYAYQWFGFALTLFVIYIVLNIKRIKKES